MAPPISFFSLVHQLGSDTSHNIIPVFFGGGGAPMKIPLYHTTSIPRIFVRCCTSPSLSNN